MIRKITAVIIMWMFILVSTAIINAGYLLVADMRGLFGIEMIVTAIIGVAFELIGIFGIGVSAIAIEHIIGGGK